MKAFEWMDIDWVGIVIPSQCIGTFSRRMLIISMTPLLMMGLLVMSQFSTQDHAGHSFLRCLQMATLRSITLILLLVFLFCPSVNREIFRS